MSRSTARGVLVTYSLDHMGRSSPMPQCHKTTTPPAQCPTVNGSVTDDFDGNGNVDLAAGVLQFQIVLAGVHAPRLLDLQLAHFRFLRDAEVVVGRQRGLVLRPLRLRHRSPCTPHMQRSPHCRPSGGFWPGLLGKPSDHDQSTSENVLQCKTLVTCAIYCMQ